jgi:hypothetical protein
MVYNQLSLTWRMSGASSQQSEDLFALSLEACWDSREREVAIFCRGVCFELFCMQRRWSFATACQGVSLLCWHNQRRGL